MVNENGYEEVRVIAFQQGVGIEEGQEMYLLAAPTKWLLTRCTIDRYRPEIDDDDFEKQGYQRTLSSTHINKIRRYVLGTLRDSRSSRALPIFPTSILLSSREDLEFHPDNTQRSSQQNRASTGVLRLPNNSKLYIIDGQHRIEGLRAAIEAAPNEQQKALLEDYHLPVTIMVCKSKPQEVIHFVTINKEAKSVRTDLAERLLDSLYRKDPDLIRSDDQRDLIAIKTKWLAVVEALETTPNQPWFGRIARPNEQRKGEKVASEGQLSKSLRHIFNASLGWSLDKIKRYVIDFWKALEELLPEAFENPSEYVIQGAVGFGALHRLLPTVIALHYDGTPESIKRILEGIDPYFTDAEYWKRGTGEATQYSSEGGYQKHADMIAYAINEKLAASQ